MPLMDRGNDVSEVSTPAPERAERVDILVVDDNRKNLLAIEELLNDPGLNVVRAQSGVEALRRLLAQDFALALLDIQMPELDGFQTAEIIRSRDRSRHMPIIFLTAFSRSDEQISRGYELGAVDFLFKPISPFVLRAKVAAFVDLFRKTEEIKRQGRLLREIEKREYERQLAEANQRWEAERLREEMIKERRAAETLARTVAERERAEAALQASNRRLELLADLAGRLLLGPRPEDLLATLCGQLAEHLGLEVYCNYLVDGAGLRLGAHGGPGTAEALVDAPVGPLSAEVAETRAARVAERVQSSNDPALALARGLGLRACACFPLLAQEHLLGTLAFGTATRDAVAADDLAVLRVVCDQVAMALERARLIDELSVRNRALAEDDRRKDEFLAMLAHELRNPLAPIVNSVHVLRRPETTPDVAARATAAIDRQVRHLARLVDDLLDLARITSGKIELRFAPVTLASIVDQAVQTCAPLLQQRDQHLSVSLPDHEVALLADATRLTQVAANLINNAARYSPPGSPIRVDCAVEGAEAVIRVSDEGIGIEPEMISRIFELFVQSDRRPDRSQGGLGLGLTLVRRLVELHRGTVTARSEGLTRGSVFEVRLPISGAPAPASEAPPPPRAERPRRSVVLVEDNADVRESMQICLESWGHAVASADDGPSGVELVLARRPDVALVDIGLPGLDGHQVAAAIRARAPDLPVRLIALTGYGRPSDRELALASGFDDHLVKPVDLDRLQEVLAET